MYVHTHIPSLTLTHKYVYLYAHLIHLEKRACEVLVGKAGGMGAGSIFNLGVCLSPTLVWIAPKRARGGKGL